jgi:hypothetical protein
MASTRQPSMAGSAEGQPGTARLAVRVVLCSAKIINIDTFGTNIPAGCISALMAFETCRRILWTFPGTRFSESKPGAALSPCYVALQLLRGPPPLALLHTAPMLVASLPMLGSVAV